MKHSYVPVFSNYYDADLLFEVDMVDTRDRSPSLASGQPPLGSTSLATLESRLEECLPRRTARKGAQSSALRSSFRKQSSRLDGAALARLQARMTEANAKAVDCRCS